MIGASFSPFLGKERKLKSKLRNFKTKFGSQAQTYVPMRQFIKQAKNRCFTPAVD
jgi:hypothetical protein